MGVLVRVGEKVTVGVRVMVAVKVILGVQVVLPQAEVGDRVGVDVGTTHCTKAEHKKT
jgi:hypothetical protein